MLHDTRFAAINASIIQGYVFGTPSYVVVAYTLGKYLYYSYMPAYDTYLLVGSEHIHTAAIVRLTTSYSGHLRTISCPIRRRQEN